MSQKVLYGRLSIVKIGQNLDRKAWGGDGSFPNQVRFKRLKAARHAIRLRDIDVDGCWANYNKWPTNGSSSASSMQRPLTLLNASSCD